MIQLTEATVRYSQAASPVLSGLDFVCTKGSFTVISGPTGSGKSTLFRMLSGELVASKGTVRVADFDLTDRSLKRVAAYRREVGLVFQDLRLLEEKTIGANIGFALEILPRSKRFDAANRLSTVLERFDLSSVSDKYPREVSHGEQRMAAIARAVVREPFVLIADDPTGQLDAASGAGIAEILLKEHARGMTVIVFTTTPEVFVQRSSAVRHYRFEGSGLVLSPT